MTKKDIIKEYPFIEINKECSKKGYTWLDELEPGWNKSFGLNLCKDLKDALIKDNRLEDFSFIQIKEKFGELNLYANNYGNNTKKVLAKYKTLSKYICARCGKPARYITIDWIYPLCEDCINNVRNDYKKIEDFYIFNSYNDVLEEIDNIKNN